MVGERVGQLEKVNARLSRFRIGSPYGASKPCGMNERTTLFGASARDNGR